DAARRRLPDEVCAAARFDDPPRARLGPANDITSAGSPTRLRATGATSRSGPMKRILTATIVAAFTAGVAAQQQSGAGPTAPVLTPGPSAARFPRNADEFDQMFNQVKNWGRWGKDDQLGAANLITEAKRKQALALAKNGVTVSLAHSPLTEAAPDNGS